MILRLKVTFNLVLFLAIILINPLISSTKGKQETSGFTSAKVRLQSWEYRQKLKRESPFRNLKWQTLGPALAGGRIESIASLPEKPGTIYIGAGSGNLWRSINGGITWKPIFDDQSTFAIGSVAIAPSRPKTIWVGTGEVLMARSSYAGTGIFKSIDSGESWQNMGLQDTHHIARVLIDPQNPDIVYAAAIGHNYSFNTQRGLFKTEDGGNTWKKILYISDRVGCIEVVMHPVHSQTLFAVMWERDRKAWNHSGTGKNCGIYRTVDGGKKWVRLAHGFPAGGKIGRIGLAIAPSNPKIIYALVENQNQRMGSNRPVGGEVYRSNDSGRRWEKVNLEYLKTAIGYDFCLIRVSPDDENQIYLLGNYLLQSSDGGKTYTRNKGKIINLRPHDAKMLHLDCHDLWIDPQNGNRMILGTDGGAYLSSDRGLTWLRLNNMPLAEVYAVTVDNGSPYRIYIGTQDNAALFAPGNFRLSDTEFEPWEYVYLDPWGGGDSYFTRVDPNDPGTIYYEHQFGVLRRKNMKSGSSLITLTDS